MDPQTEIVEQKRLARNAYQREWRAQNKEKVSASKALYKEKHPDVMLEASRRHEAIRKEKRLLERENTLAPPVDAELAEQRRLARNVKKREWRAQNKEKVAVSKALYKEKHPDVVLEASRRHEAIRKEKRLLERASKPPKPPKVTESPKAYQKAWRAANPDKVEQNRRRYNDAHREDLRERSKRYNTKRLAEQAEQQAELKRVWEASEAPSPSWLTKPPLIFPH